MSQQEEKEVAPKKKRSKLKLLDSTKFISDSVNGITKLTKTYELDGNKFQICYENSNGKLLGFNSKMCLKQYRRDAAQWNYLEDISVLDISKEPSYYDMHNSKLHCELFFKLMEKRLIKIYSHE